MTDSINIDSIRAAIGRKYFWIIGLHEGKTILLGPYGSEDAATTVGIEKLEGDFSVIPLPTRNEARATRIIKARKLKEGRSLGSALEKISHNKPSGEL